MNLRFLKKALETMHSWKSQVQRASVTTSMLPLTLRRENSPAYPVHGLNGSKAQKSGIVMHLHLLVTTI